ENVMSGQSKGHFVSSSIRKHIPFLIIFSLTNLIFGIIFTFLYSRLFEFTLNYNQSGNYEIFLPASTIYFYIQLDDFYQTNLKYSKSISYDQLEGKKDTNRSKTEPLDSIDGLDYYPAGIITNPPLWDEYTEVPDLENDERYINWISTSPFSNFRKLWGVINVEKEGEYLLFIESTFPYGKKSLYFSEMSWMGTKNYFLSMGMIVSGVVGIILSLVLYKIGI
ncbi:cell cycle control protein, partial [Vairimorpha apis BRL 01]